MTKPSLIQYLFPAIFLICNLFTNQSFSQCQNTTVWGGANAPTDIASASISNCNYAGEFANVSNIIAGNVYVVTSANCNDYITVYDQADGMVGHSNTPFEFTATSSGTYEIHFNMDNNCGTEGACRATFINCLSCGAIPGCMDPIATNYDPAVTFNDCSCIIGAISNDECANAMNLDAFINMDGTCNLSNLSAYSGATSSTTEIAPSSLCSDGDPTPIDVWYSLTVPASGIISFDFLSTPGFSSISECYTGTCGNLNPYNPVLCNNEPSRTFIDLTPGNMILFRVWDYGSNDVGNHEVCIKQEIAGCTDPTATNYDPNATYEDGTCSYPTANKPCVATNLNVNEVCTVGDNTLGGMEAGEIAGNCFNGTNNTVWFKFVADAEVMNVSTDFGGYTSTDTEIAIYTADDCAIYNTFFEVACDQDGGVIENNNSMITGAITTIGETYYIQVSGWNGTQGTFCIEVTSAPANNELCGAQPTQCGDLLLGNTTGYSLSTSSLPIENCGSGEQTAPNVFYQINGTGDDFVLSLCNSTFDTRLDVFCLVGGSCGDSPQLVCVAGNDDSPTCGAANNSEVTFSTLSSSKYYIMVHGYGTTTGNFELSIDCNTAATPPDNQDCENNGLSCRMMGAAEEITVDTACNYTYGTNIGSGQAIVTPPCAMSSYESVTDVWYMFNTGDYTGFEVEILEYTALDVRHALYAECGGIPMFCDANIFYGLAPNTNYYLQLFTQKGNEGDFEMCLSTAQLCAFMTTPSGNDVNINTELSWSEAFTATGYQLMIGTSQGSDDFMPLADLGNVLTYTPSTFNYNTTYYATILPYNDFGEVSNCPSFSFTTKCPAIQSDIVSMIDGSCYGSNDAAIDISVLGGEGPYSYNWTGPNGFINASEDIVQITGGEYQLTVTDNNNGCTITESFEVAPMEGMTSITNVVDEACGNDGSAEIVVFGGAEPYTYQWSTGSSEAVSTNIPSGTYQVTVTDADGCTELFDGISVGNEGELAASVVNVTGVGCGSTTGSITISPMTGMGPYDYSWSSITGSTNGSITGINGSYAISALPIGDYNITITDVNTCVGYINNISIQVVDEIQMEISEVVHPDCYNSYNGIVTVSAIIGQAPFQFIWSNGLTVPESAGVESLNGISGGNYSVTITDANGCTGISSVIEVDEPAQLNVVVHNVESPVCFGDPSGQVYIDIEGGSEPFIYTWSNGYSTEDLIGVSAGNYLLTITDANGCSANTPVVTVENPTAIEINLNDLESITCFGKNEGSISTGIFGGNPPYDIQWNNGSNSANLDFLPGGDYQCTITDAVGCQQISPIYTITAPEEAIELVVEDITDSPCNGFDYGSIDVSIMGGTAPYTYHWSNGAATQNINGLSSGNYLLTVTDNNACIFISEIIFVDEPDELHASTSSTPEVNDMNDGTATVNVVGGTMPYSYTWDSNAGNQNMPTATGLAAGSYMVTINDVNGCMMVTTVEVGSDINIATNEVSQIKRMELSPNPTLDEAQLLIELSDIEQIQIEVYDMAGKKVLNPQIYKARQLLTIIDLSQESAGVYLVKVNIGGEVRNLMLVKN